MASIGSTRDNASLPVTGFAHGLCHESINPDPPMRSDSKKIAIDGRWMVGNYRGMGRFAHAFIQPIRNDTTIFVPKSYDAADSATIKHGLGFFPYWEQFILPRLCRQFRVTHLVCPYNTGPINVPNGTKLILAVHDLIYLESWSTLRPSSSMYQTLGRVYRRWNVPRAVRRADRIVTVSEYSAAQIRGRFGECARGIDVIPNSVPDAWFVDAPLPVDARAREILTVSGDAPSKNLESLIRAYSTFKERLPTNQEAPLLRIVGVKPRQQAHFVELAQRHGAAQSIRFEGFLDDAQLRALYRRATFFVLPSLFEGFGIPIAEAMASGTPVACSNTTSLPEVLQQAGWLFDPGNIQDIASVLTEAWLDKEKRDRYALLGVRRAQRFRQSTVAQQITDFWERI
jgi:glycosyltransferase involved in cell wall biosynthesis